nr:DNA helicase [Tanacetum cinerariifolium]
GYEIRPWGVEADICRRFSVFGVFYFFLRGYEIRPWGVEADICRRFSVFGVFYFFLSNGHTQYRRRDTGIHVMKGESRLDNCNIIPYNRALCLAFEAHINVEYCGWREPEEEDQHSSWITISPEYSVGNDETGLLELINFIYDNTTLKTPTASSL